VPVGFIRYWSKTSRTRDTQHSDLGQHPGEAQPVQQAEGTYRGVQSSAQSARQFCGNLAISRHFIPALREAGS
jgi:hypothetical protein